ncbi:hypothetical protein POTOM_030855 [Populus tomentosa]|uniref:Uncharacterized protein n=1 Tax=Populus tomentosa TaxID=118781 RepID=A0A8X7Z7A0_POPTO|nr:hypothetical protein POTOM_030855 [Populus tomentosa]
MDATNRSVVRVRMFPCLQSFIFHHRLTFLLITTQGLPNHLLGNLMQAFDMASSSFSSILTTLRPDFLICDFFQPWAPALALSLNIPTVQFVVSGSKANSVAVHALKKSGVVVQDSAKDFLFIKDRILQHLEQSSGIMLARSLREIEGKYLDDLSAVTMKRVLPVGPLCSRTFCRR